MSDSGAALRNSAPSCRAPLAHSSRLRPWRTSVRPRVSATSSEKRVRKLSIGCSLGQAADDSRAASQEDSTPSSAQRMQSSISCGLSCVKGPDSAAAQARGSRKRPPPPPALLAMPAPPPPPSRRRREALHFASRTRPAVSSGVGCVSPWAPSARGIFSSACRKASRGGPPTGRSGRAAASWGCAWRSWRRRRRRKASESTRGADPGHSQSTRWQTLKMRAKSKSCTSSARPIFATREASSSEFVLSQTLLSRACTDSRWRYKMFSWSRYETSTAPKFENGPEPEGPPAGESPAAEGASPAAAPRAMVDAEALRRQSWSSKPPALREPPAAWPKMPTTTRGL
mmetsp:Transcript_98348/g.317056  ORF Transcript_98348/g.317056 Transcript_98348/m.317056 type:complete len:342 (+) Transcript_98348:2094-3119(+)